MKIDVKKLKLVPEPERVNGIACAAVEVRCELCNGPMIVRVPEQHIELYLEDFDFCPHNAPTLDGRSS
jgi:hypothetical protein